MARLIVQNGCAAFQARSVAGLFKESRVGEAGLFFFPVDFLNGADPTVRVADLSYRSEGIRRTWLLVYPPRLQQPSCRSLHHLRVVQPYGRQDQNPLMTSRYEQRDPPLLFRRSTH